MTRTPIHPGIILADEMEELGMSASQVAKSLGVPVNRITQIMKGTRAITADTALRLGRWLNMSPKFWMNLQQAYELRLADAQMGKEIKQSIKVLPVRKMGGYDNHVNV